MSGRVSDREREHARKLASVYPRILARIRGGDELLEIADQVAGEVEVDRETAYRWIHEVDRVFQRRRRVIAQSGAVLLWIAALAGAGALLIVVLGIEGTFLGIPVAAALLIVVLLFLPPALYLSLRADALALSRRSPFEEPK